MQYYFARQSMKSNETKYKLVVNYVIDGIRAGRFHRGDLLPSVNEFIERFNVSRVTVFAGINELRTKGIVESKQGVGNFISSTEVANNYNVFLLFNELNEFKEDLYRSLVDNLEKDSAVNIQFHNYNRDVFDQLLADARGKYTTYIVMTGKFRGTAELLNSLGGRVYLLDHFDKELKGLYTSVAQDFQKDTYECLTSGVDILRKYSNFIMVQNEAKEPYERYYGLTQFCEENGFSCKYLNNIGNRKIHQGDVFLLVNDRDLVTIIKQAQQQGFTPGKEFGIISYNDTPLKEVLCGGITTISTDFQEMGRTMASLVKKKTIATIRNTCSLKIRGSI